MRTIRRDLGGVRPRDQSALWPCMALPGGDIVRVEQEGEALVENLVSGHVRLDEKRLKEPGRVRAVPFCRTCVRHRLDRLILRGKRSGAALCLASHAAEGFEQALAIGAKQVEGGFLKGGRHQALRSAEFSPASLLSYRIVSAMSRVPES